jgi:hypothetical protein
VEIREFLLGHPKTAVRPLATIWWDLTAK